MYIDVSNVSISFEENKEQHTILNDVSLQVEKGEFICLLGPSGCGKSTLLSAIAGLEPLSGGAIEIDGRAVQGTSPKIGFMPQRDQLFEWRNIWDNVTLGLTVRGEKDPAAYAHVSRLLERYGLASFAKKRPCQLSGGMRQRCPPSRRSCCWMSRFPRWITRHGWRCRRISGAYCSRRAKRPCWSPMTSLRR